MELTPVVSYFAMILQQICFFWIISALISFKDVKLETISVRHSHSLQWFNVIMVDVGHCAILQHSAKTSKLN